MFADFEREREREREREVKDLRQQELKLIIDSQYLLVIYYTMQSSSSHREVGSNYLGVDEVIMISSFLQILSKAPTKKLGGL